MNDTEKAAGAVAALDSAPAVQNADAIATAFEAAGARIATSLEDATRRGELSFDSLAESVLKDLTRLAVGEFIETPLNALIDRLAASQPGQSGGATTVNLYISGASDPGGFRRSEGQIAATLARAVATGRQRI